MKKTLIIVLAVFTLCLAFSACGKAPVQTQETAQASPSDSQSAETSLPSGESQSPAETSAAPVSDGTPASSYSAFLEAKSAVFTRLSDGLTQKDLMAGMTVAGFGLADLMMLPVSFCGIGKEAAEAGLAMFNATGVNYSESGNTYTISYTGEDGALNAFTATYDAASDALSCTVQENGKDSFFAEYRRTSYGYASQYYFLNDDGTASLYQFTVSGEDGVLGYSSAQSSKPAALTGSEAADFPAALPEWYGIKGSAITGVSSDGSKLDFEYTPSAE